MKYKQIQEKYIGSNNREALYDIMFPENDNGNLILFIHGYMGFKDWGAWGLLQKYFVENNFVFCKANLSHNGIGIDTNKLTEFTDLDAFSRDTYTIEKNDVRNLIELLSKLYPNLKLSLMGHSRGGAITILNTMNEKVFKTICLASISSIEKRFRDNEMIEKWKKDKIRYVENQRTKQQMPHSIVQYTDFLENRNELDVENVCRSINKDVILFHGENDTSVLLSEGEELAQLLNTDLIKIKNCDHVFGSTHPWDKSELPEQLKIVADKIITSYN